MKIVGDPDPATSNSLGGVNVEVDELESCDHTPDGWTFDEEHHAFLVSVCEHCGRRLVAEEIDEKLLKDTGEVSVESFREE